MARYLGPMQYVNLDYEMSLTSQLACIASFGINMQTQAFALKGLPRLIKQDIIG